jgi:hypothetical protein
MIELVRTSYTDKATFGVLLKDGVPQCDTVEKPWKDNHNKTSCIPEGTYEYELYFSPSKKYEVWLLKNVPNRSFIEIHIANFAHELEGCIAPGQGYIHTATETGVANSTDAFKYLKRVLPKTSNITIRSI